MDNPDVPEATAEEQRHMSRTSIGIGVGVLVAVLVLCRGSVGTLLFGCVLGAIGGAWLGSMMDIRGAICDGLDALHKKLDPYRKDKETEDGE